MNSKSPLEKYLEYIGNKTPEELKKSFEEVLNDIKKSYPMPK